MRIRSIRPEFWRSDDISALCWDTRLVFIGLWSYVDDNGVGVDKLASIVADLFADDLAQDPAETIAKVSRALLDLSSGGLIARYEVDGKKYLHVRGFGRHQRVDKPSKPRYPQPPAMTENVEPVTSGYGDTREPSRDIPGGVEEDSTPGEGEKGRRGEGEKGITPPSEECAPAKAGSPSGRGTRLPDDWKPATVDQDRMTAEHPDVDLSRETEKFRDYWPAQPGAKGRKTDWDRTWRNWIRRAAEDLARHNARTAPQTPGNALAVVTSDQAINLTDGYAADRARRNASPLPADLHTRVARRIDECLTAGIDPRQIAAGLHAWEASTLVSPAHIPDFVHKASTRPAATPGIGKPTAKARGYLDAAENLIARQEAANQ